MVVGIFRVRVVSTSTMGGAVVGGFVGKFDEESPTWAPARGFPFWAVGLVEVFFKNFGIARLGFSKLNVCAVRENNRDGEANKVGEIIL